MQNERRDEPLNNEKILTKRDYVIALNDKLGTDIALFARHGKSTVRVKTILDEIITLRFELSVLYDLIDVEGKQHVR